MKKYMKYLKYGLAFIIPIVIFCIALLINDIAPFGKHLITVNDSFVQYPGFFMALKNFHFYLFNVGFGFNFLGTVTYYLMSPLNLLIYFFDLTSYNTFYFLLIILKIGLCGLSMQYFLSHEEKHDNLWSTIFSIIYALIGFVASYHYNVFWLDSIIMLPIVLVGINKIIDNKSPLFYIVSLAITIILSFYTGYMCCIFSVIYFIYKLVETNKYKDKKIIKTFIISSLLVGLISTIVILPSYFALSAGKAQGYSDGYTKYFGFSKNIMYLPYSFTPGNYEASQISQGFAQVYCSLFVVCLFIFSFFNTKISKKTKITTLIIILFYLLSFSFNLVDYAWQFFQKPVWWQHRYSFTLSLFMIIIAYKNLMTFDKVKLSNIKKGIIYLILAVLIITTFILFYHSLTLKTKFRLVIIAFSIILLINYIFFTDNKGKYKYVIIGLIILEVGLNCYISVKSTTTRAVLEFHNNEIKDNMKYLSQIQEDNFYRTEITDNQIYNKGLQYNYNGLNYFNSVRNQRVVNAMDYYFHFNVSSYCSIRLVTYDPYILSLFNIKYLISDIDIPYYEKINDHIYRNNYPLGLGFMVNKDLLNVKLKKNDYFNNISKIYRAMLNENVNLYHQIDNLKITYDNVKVNKKDKTYNLINKDNTGKVTVEFVASEDLLFIDAINKWGNITSINDQQVSRDYSYKNNLYPYAKKGDKVKLEITVFDTEKISDFYYISIAEYQNIINKLNKTNLTNVKLNEKHTFEGTIDVKEDSLLFTSIAYEKGMTVKVNGEKVKPELIFDAFIGLNLKKGENIITIDYIPQGLKEGIIISLTGILLTIIYTHKLKINKKSVKKSNK